MKKIISSIRKRPIISSIVGIIILLIIGYFIFSKRNTTAAATIVVHPKDFTQQLSVTGTVTAAQNVDLGFAQSGRVSEASAHVGDTVTAGTILAQIENGDARAAVLQKQAALEKEQATLSSLEEGTRPEELASTQQKYTDALTALNAAMNSTYSQIEDAILNKTDTFFTYGNSANPTLTLTAESWNEERSIEMERYNLTLKFSALKASLASNNTLSVNEDSVQSTRIATDDLITTTNTFLDHISRIVGNLYPNSTGLPQSTIDSYRQTLNAAMQEVSKAAASEQSAESAVNSAQNALTLEKAGSTSQSITAQISQVKAAQADVESAVAELNRTIVRAPFDGIVTKMDAKVGQIVSPEDTSISMISTGTFEIQSFVPEVYISNLAVGNIASTTLDAYGPSVFFPAKVIAIDPAQTVVNGVSNYKTTLEFLDNDPRIRQGMTASIVITTQSIPNALVVPQGAVFTQDNQQFVQIKQGKNTINQPVTTGVASTLGDIQITSGLHDGDTVVLNPSTK